MTADSIWLSISEAAKYLGIHIATLRRWSDQGLIAYVRTPGGKRKFQLDALDAFINQHRSPVKEPSGLIVFQDQTITRTRQQLQSLGIYQTLWYRQMTDEQRLYMRSSGSRLVALMLHYSASIENSETFLEEAGRITREYGRVCRVLGINMTDCVQTFLLFRQPILNAVHETGALSGADDEQNFLLFEKLNRFFDETMIAMIDAYQQG